MWRIELASSDKWINPLMVSTPRTGSLGRAKLVLQTSYAAAGGAAGERKGQCCVVWVWV